MKIQSLFKKYLQKNNLFIALIVMLIIGLIVVISLASGYNINNKEKMTTINDVNNNSKTSEIFQDWVQDAEKYSEKVISQNKLTKANSYNTTKTLKQLESNDKIQYFLSGAISRPECCPSIYSNSSGCLCLTKEQNDFISRKN